MQEAFAGESAAFHRIAEIRDEPVVLRNQGPDFGASRQDVELYLLRSDDPKIGFLRRQPVCEKNASRLPGKLPGVLSGRASRVVEQPSVRGVRGPERAFDIAGTDQEVDILAVKSNQTSGVGQFEVIVERLLSL